jgi:hypothetical protein
MADVDADQLREPRDERSTGAAEASAESTRQSRRMASDLRGISAKLRAFSRARKKIMREREAPDEKT